MKKQKRHKHYFTTRSYFKGNAEERCRCGATRERPQTKAETKHLKSMWKKSSDVHRIWHPLLDALKKAGADRAKQHAVENKFSKKKGIRWVHCDDGYHSNSGILLVPHESKISYMGVTFLFFPQCDPNPPLPAELFLYPDDLVSLRKELQALEKEMRAGVKRERAFEREEQRRLQLSRKTQK